MSWRLVWPQGVSSRLRSHDEVTGATTMFEPGTIGYLIALAVAIYAPMVAVFIMLPAAIVFWIPSAVLPRRGPDSA